MTRELKSLTLSATLMVVHRHILLSLASAAIAEAVLMRTSAEREPPLHIRYRCVQNTTTKKTTNKQQNLCVGNIL